jgi:hypothetical protein
VSETQWFDSDAPGLSTLNGDGWPNCNPGDIQPPEIIYGTITLTKPNLCKVKLRFWRNIFSNCNSLYDLPDIAEEKVIVTCTNGRILVENLGMNTRQTLNNGNNVVYNSIGLDPAQGDVAESTAGDTIIICLSGTENATFTVEATLNWTTQRDHDLYGNISC